MRLRFTTRTLLFLVFVCGSSIVLYKSASEWLAKQHPSYGYALAASNVKNGDTLESVCAGFADFKTTRITEKQTWNNGPIYDLQAGDIVLTELRPHGVEPGTPCHFAYAFVFRENRVIDHPRDSYSKVVRHPIFDRMSRQLALTTIQDTMTYWKILASICVVLVATVFVFRSARSKRTPMQSVA